MSEYQYKKGEIQANMPREHAEAIRSGDNRMPRKGDTCNMSCQFAFACANHVRGEPCTGFQLLSNGKLERHIKHNLDEYDRKSIERYVNMIQRSHSPEILNHLVPVVYRSLKPPEKEYTMIGLQTYEIVRNKDGTQSLRLPERPPKPTPPQNPIHESELRYLSRNQNRIKEKKENEPA